MFEALTKRLSSIQKKLGSKGRLKPKDVDEFLEEVNLALLDADVNLEVARAFIERVRAAAMGSDIHSALDASQQMVKILNQELTNTLGPELVELEMAKKPPTVIMMVGLQGTGKTTAAVKLANHLKQKKLRPLLVGADLQRPAALEQLQILAGEADIPVVCDGKTPKAVVQNALKSAKQAGRDVVICDTAGRITIDQPLMDELVQVSKAISPDYTLLVLDSMSGQDSLRVGTDFNEVLDLSGVILTKLDGDARGGSALSVREVVGKPVYFSSTGERLADFDVFHPDRLAGRILGMGDVLTLIEQAEGAYEVEEQKEMEESAVRILEGQFTFNDFLQQMRMVQKMGMDNLLEKLPEASGAGEVEAAAAEKRLKKVEAIICSMTYEERINPEVIDGSRRKRIAKGSGTTPTDVSALVRDFMSMRKEMKKMKGMGKLLSRMGM